MHNFRLFGLVLLCFVFSAMPAIAGSVEETKDSPKSETVTQQQLVESVDIQGNRRLRDDDLLYYIKTRAGDIYNQAQVENDLQQLLSLNFFDKVETRVFTEPGVRGGVNVIFEVKELPIIRDLQFEGLKAVPESDVLKAFREQRVGISKEAVYNPVNAQKGIRVIRELLASKGYPNAKVAVKDEDVSATSTAITFDVDQGNQSRIVDIEFEGNSVFSDGELRSQLQLVKETGIITRFQGLDILDLRKLQYDLDKNVRSYMFSKGYFQARVGEPQVVGLGYKRTGLPLLKELALPVVSSKDDTLKIVIPITEGKLYRVGDLKVEGNSIFSEQQILAGLGLKKGDIADGKRLINGVREDLKKAYGSQGFVLYEADFDPEFKDNPNNPNEGIVDITIRIDEGKQFRLRRLEFTGNTFTRDRVLRREVLINEGDIYNQNALELSVLRLNQTQYFDPIDKDQDVEIRTDDEQGDVDLIVKVREKGRQQISLNGGVSGIGGTFFGLEYSTNNLLGRGEILSFQFGLGNVQQSFQFTFQEPYFRDRPISVGFSLTASRYRYLGEGTALTQNQDLLSSLYTNPNVAYTTDRENLFTSTTYGATLFATAPLSEFLPKRPFSRLSRIGLTYQFLATSVSEPAANSSGDPNRFIPSIFTTPNYTTSRVSPTFVYDSRRSAENGIDTLSGKQLSASIALAGLGGDVRTYQPTISYMQFIPVRRKRSKNAEVFGFRLFAGTVGSFAVSDKIRNSNSLSFIGGVPYQDRYRLGSEYDIRGYDNRAITPFAPTSIYVTSRNVVVANNATGTPVVVPGLSSDVSGQLAQLGTFTGASGDNPALVSSYFTPIPADTQLLGNFEYRIPIFGPVSLAAFADIGSAFNLRKTGIETINDPFLSDDNLARAGLLGVGALNQLFFRANPGIESSLGSLILRNNTNLLTTEEGRIICLSNRFGCPVSLPQGLQAVNLRGEAQRNQLINVDDSLFDSIGDFRSSLGMELRVQVPVVNVPFRLIYYLNPNVPDLPGNFAGFRLAKRSGFRFTVGRTF